MLLDPYAFQQCLLEAADFAERWRIIRHTFEPLGIQTLTYVLLPEAGNEDVPPPLFQSTMPEAWHMQYAEERYDLVDPTMARLRSDNLLPLESGREWNEIGPSPNPELAPIYDDLAQSGWSHGAAIPIRWQLDRQLLKGGFGLASESGPAEFHSLWSEKEVELLLAVQIFHQFNYDCVPFRSDRPRLTARESDVLKFVAEGLRAKQIAARLSLSKPTIDFHIRNAKVKLGARSLMEAVSLAMRHKLI